MIDFSLLNKEQKEAVLYDEGPLLIVAGAGSGKTRVLTTKIAYLLEEGKASPWEILAFTFTNKAAREMKERACRLCAQDISSMWMGTFHSIAVKILRREAAAAGLSPLFTIYDRHDQKSLLKEVCRELFQEHDRIGERYFFGCVDKIKNIGDPERRELIREQVLEGPDSEIRQAYELYQKKLAQYQALDFNDLILYTITLFQNHPEICDKYAERFRYIFVDEYQDTNNAQYILIRLLAKVHQNVIAVGDGDQSIYGWRGADMRNILDFEKDFPKVKTILLEQNYRSTSRILRAANQLIAHNTERKVKVLRTDNAPGEPIVWRLFQSDLEEASVIAREIRFLTQTETPARQIAILYRQNAQSRVIEQQMLREGLAYQVVGGLKFYDRKEIKDVIAYLQMMLNPKDNGAVKRIINVPKRGIGDKTVENIERAADQAGLSITEYIKRGEFSALKAQAKKVQPILKLLKKWEKPREEGQSLSAYVLEKIEETGYLDELRNSGEREDQTRLENISAFIDAVEDFENDDQLPEEEKTLAQFMTQVALLSDVDKEKKTDGVSLMTIHSAKGLEYDHVYLVGLNETVMPSHLAINEGGEEEERRLMYVAITRAAKELHLSSSVTARRFGQTESFMPSRFIDELEGEIVKEQENTQMKQKVEFRESYDKSLDFMKDAVLQSFSAAPKVTAKNMQEYAVGDKVKHKKFGQGLIIQVAGDELTINFETKGLKKLNKNLAPLERLSE